MGRKGVILEKRLNRKGGSLRLKTTKMATKQ